MDHAQKLIIFGAWDIYEESYRCKIFEPSWQVKNNGKKNSGFKQSLQHIKLIENDNYSLKTFRIFHTEGNPITGTAKIKGFISEVVDRVLVKDGNSWYAYVTAARAELSENIGSTDEIFMEGEKKNTNSVTTARNGAAREECLKLFGLDCAVCDFNFNNVYGTHGKGFIHVHHLNPIATKTGEYVIDPKNDLRPVCPNCHAMLHRRTGLTPLSINELKKLMSEAKKP